MKRDAKTMSRVDCYCAFCKSPRKVYAKKRIGLMNIFASALGAILTMYAIFQGLDPRVFFIFVLFLAISETFVQLRWRIAMVCKHCGFDPVLYLKSHERAAEKVKKHLEIRSQDPATLLKTPLQIPKISKKRAEEIKQSSPQKKGSLVSRQV
jgi:hypothetical protein